MVKRSLYWFTGFICSIILAFLVSYWMETQTHYCSGILENFVKYVIIGTVFWLSPSLTACVIFFDLLYEQQNIISWKLVIRPLFWGGTFFLILPYLGNILSLFYHQVLGKPFQVSVYCYDVVFFSFSFFLIFLSRKLKWP